MTAHPEQHRSHRAGWLRASVLGANDGIVSTSSLIIGVTAANSSQSDILLAGMAGLVAGAMSMAAAEYVSVSSQADIHRADLAIEQRALKEHPRAELEELADIYRARGLSSELSQKVAEQLMAHDALAAHARDEIGITEVARARPLQAAVSSALAFTLGGVLPVLAALLLPAEYILQSVAILTLLFLACMGGIAALAGGAPVIRAACRVAFFGTLAMLSTAAVGFIFGAV